MSGDESKASSWNVLDAELALYEGTYWVPGLSCRSIAAPLADGGIFVYSPGAALVANLPDELREKGDARVLLAPNSFHHLGIKAWKSAFPGAIGVAADGARARLAKQGHPDLQPLARLREKLPASMDVLEVPGTRIGESWLRWESSAGVGWAVGDAFFNMPRLSHKLHLRLLSWLLSSAPGLAISGLMKWGGVNDRRAYKSWLLDQLARDQPKVLVPNHGDVLRADDLPARLKELIERRL